MLFLIWGNKVYVDLLGYIVEKCPACTKMAPFAVRRVRKKFTVFFIPLFTYSSKQFLECRVCGASFEVPRDLKEKVQASLMSQEELSRLIASLPEDEKNALPESAADEMKRCPYCAEEIQAAAIYCRFCKRDLSPPVELVEEVVEESIKRPMNGSPGLTAANGWTRASGARRGASAGA